MRAALLVALVALSCGMGTTPSVEPQEAALKTSEARGLARCASSGTIDHFLAVLKTSDPTGYADTSRHWATLQREGASSAYYVMYAESAADCQITATTGRLITNQVVLFASSSQAGKSWTGESAGLDPKAAVGSGGKTGTETGLGASSLSGFYRPSDQDVYYALWQRGRWLGYFYAQGFGESDSRAMAKLVAARQT